METKIVINLTMGTLEVQGSEEFVKFIYEDFKNLLKEKSNIITTEIDSFKQKTNKKKSSKTTSVGTKKGTKESLTLVNDLNLIPKNNKSLKDFIKEYKIDSNFEKNLIIIYYLQKVLDMKNINVNHIYTCYKELSWKIPLALTQSLLDTKNRKGWIETNDTNDLKVTIKGENFVVHEINSKIEKSK